MRSRPVVMMSSASRSCSSIGGGSEAVLLRRPPGWPTKLPLVLPLKLEEEARRSTQESLKEVDLETEIVRGMVDGGALWSTARRGYRDGAPGRRITATKREDNAFDRLNLTSA